MPSLKLPRSFYWTQKGRPRHRISPTQNPPPPEEGLYQELFHRGRSGVLGTISGLAYDGRHNLGDYREDAEPGRAVLFDGATQHIDTGEILLPETGAWFLSCWVKVVAFTGTDYILTTFGTAAGLNLNGFAIYLPDPDITFWWDNDGGSYPASLTQTFTPTLGTWYHLAAERSGANITCYVNNASIGTLAGEDAGRIVRQQNMSIGAAYATGPAGYGNFAIQDLRILQRVVTATERTAIYDQGLNPNRLVIDQPAGADYHRWLPLDDNSQTTVRCCVTGNSYTITGGDASSPYEGTDVPWSRQNVTGFTQT